MNATAKRRARANPEDNDEVNQAAMQQMMALAIMSAEDRLARLMVVRMEDEDWDDDDYSIDMAVELSLTHIRSMKDVKFKGYDDFTRQWFLAASAITLARKSFSRGTSIFGRCLDGLETMFAQAPEFVSYAGKMPAAGATGAG